MSYILSFFILFLSSSLDAKYVISSNSSQITASMTNKKKSPQYDIRLVSIGKNKDNVDVLKVLTQKTSKRINQKIAYNNFKRIGGVVGDVDIHLNPIIFSIKYGNTSIKAKGNVSFANSNFPVESYIYLDPTTEIVEVGIE